MELRDAHVTCNASFVTFEMVAQKIERKVRNQHLIPIGYEFIAINRFASDEPSTNRPIVTRLKTVVDVNALLQFLMNRKLCQAAVRWQAAGKMNTKKKK